MGRAPFLPLPLAKTAVAFAGVAALALTALAPAASAAQSGTDAIPARKKSLDKSQYYMQGQASAGQSMVVGGELYARGTARRPLALPILIDSTVHPQVYGLRMDITLRHKPGFAVARCALAPGEVVRAESGAMMATSAGVVVEAKAAGGLMKSLKRSVLGGESFFITSYTAPAGGGWVDFAARLPGDAIGLPVTDGLNITRGSYLCSDGDVQIDTSWGGFKNLAGNEGGFLVRASGQGQVVLAAYGAIDAADLGPNDSVVVDSGHMVAWDNGVQTQLRRAAAGGLMQSAKSGEGFVFDVQGPGRIWTQSRNPKEFVSWLTNELPFSRD